MSFFFPYDILYSVEYYSVSYNQCTPKRPCYHTHSLLYICMVALEKKEKKKRRQSLQRYFQSSKRSGTLSRIYTVSVCRSQKDRKRIALRTSSPHRSSITPPQWIDGRTNDPAGINTTCDNYSSCICPVPVLCAKQGRVDDMHAVGYGCQKRCPGYFAKPARVVEIVSIQSIFFLVFVITSQPYTLNILSDCPPNKSVTTVTHQANGHRPIQNFFDVALQQIDLGRPTT